MEARDLMDEGFWKDTGCQVAGAGQAHIECGGGCVIFPTSGSTGAPKWIALRKDAILHSAVAVNEWLGVGAGAVWGLALPMGHVGGFGVAARAYAAGCGLAVFEGKWDARRFAGWVKSEGVTHASLVPTQVHDLLAAGGGGAESLCAVVVGGGRLSDEAGQAARDAGWPVLASYGMTEAGSQVATQRPDGLAKPFAECPLELLPIWEAEVTSEGLLRLRGDALFCGTVEGGAFHPRKGEWFVSSDRVEISGRSIRPLGRADGMAKVMGELVDVEGIERRFIELASGRLREGSFAVLALPDVRMENRLVGVFEGEVPEGCVEDYNSRVKGPERIVASVSVESFPRTELGKIRRGELRELCLRAAP